MCNDVVCCVVVHILLSQLIDVNSKVVLSLCRACSKLLSSCINLSTLMATMIESVVWTMYCSGGSPNISCNLFTEWSDEPAIAALLA